MSRHCLWLPDYTPPSLNQLKGHWAVAAKKKKADRELVAAHALAQGLPKAAAPRLVELRVVLAAGQRAMDEDNVWKALLDSLVQAGLLKDDSPKWCKRAPAEFLRSGTDLRETFVILTDL